MLKSYRLSDPRMVLRWMLCCPTQGPGTTGHFKTLERLLSRQLCSTTGWQVVKERLSHTNQVENICVFGETSDQYFPCQQRKLQTTVGHHRNTFKSLTQNFHVEERRVERIQDAWVLEPLSQEHRWRFTSELRTFSLVGHIPRWKFIYCLHAFKLFWNQWRWSRSCTKRDSTKFFRSQKCGYFRSVIDLTLLNRYSKKL